jgi:hypothetical protein
MHERASAYERMQRFSNHPLSSHAAEVPPELIKTSAVEIGKVHDASPSMEQGAGRQQANDITAGFSL